MPDSRMVELPGGGTQNREMHFFWLLDGSGSMDGEKIASLNYAVAEAIPGMKEAAKTNKEVRLMVRALRFADDVQWIIEKPTPVAELTWDKEKEIEAGGETAMGRAIAAVVDQLDKLDTIRRFFPPVIILVTDGHATDGRVEDALRRLMEHPLGRVSSRFAVAIGSDADKDYLKTFIGNDRIPVLEANNADALVKYLKIVSTAAIKIASGGNGEAPIDEVVAAKNDESGIIVF